jgi:DNA topoisomerase-3
MAAWIDANKGTKRRKTASRTAKSISPQSTLPTTRSRRRKANTGEANPALPNLKAGTPLRIPYGNKEVAMKLGARYGTMGWYAPPGVDLTLFGERGWL